MQPKVAFNSYLPLILRGTENLVIVSGEGEVGTIKPYTGKRSAAAIRARLYKESANGDRWARLATEREPTIALAHIAVR